MYLKYINQGYSTLKFKINDVGRNYILLLQKNKIIIHSA